MASALLGWKGTEGVVAVVDTDLGRSIFSARFEGIAAELAPGTSDIARRRCSFWSPLLPEDSEPTELFEIDLLFSCVLESPKIKLEMLPLLVADLPESVELFRGR